MDNAFFFNFSVKSEVHCDWSKHRPLSGESGRGGRAHHPGHTTIQPESIQHTTICGQRRGVLGWIQHGQQLHHTRYKTPTSNLWLDQKNNCSWKNHFIWTADFYFYLFFCSSIFSNNYVQFSRLAQHQDVQQPNVVLRSSESQSTDRAGPRWRRLGPPTRRVRIMSLLSHILLIWLKSQIFLHILEIPLLSNPYLRKLTFMSVIWKTLL